MTKWIVGLAVLASLTSASSAYCQTTVTAPTGAQPRLQEWVDDSAMPTPELTLVVSFAAQPCGTRHAAGCTDGFSSIEIATGLPREEEREVLYHELGHDIDRSALLDWQRVRFKALVRRRLSEWEGVEEAFANAYTECAMGVAFHPTLAYHLEGAIVSGTVLRQTCRLIRRSPGLSAAQ